MAGCGRLGWLREVSSTLRIVNRLKLIDHDIPVAFGNERRNVCMPFRAIGKILRVVALAPEDRTDATH